MVLTQGLVSRALLASMALPFIFPSVEIDGRRLTDGVISDPLPVSAADDAHAVIALGFHGAMPGESTGQAGWSRRPHSDDQQPPARTASRRAVRRPASAVPGPRSGSAHRPVGDPRHAAHLRCGQRAAEARLPEIRAMCAQNTLAANASVIDPWSSSALA